MRSIQMRSILGRLSVLEAAVLARPVPSPSIAPGGFVVAPDAWPLDAVSAAMLVVRAVDDIDQSNDEQRGALLSDLLCGAWGSPSAQNQ